MYTRYRPMHGSRKIPSLKIVYADRKYLESGVTSKSLGQTVEITIKKMREKKIKPGLFLLQIFKFLATTGLIFYNESFFVPAI